MKRVRMHTLRTAIGSNPNETLSDEYVVMVGCGQYDQASSYTWKHSRLLLQYIWLGQHRKCIFTVESGFFSSDQVTRFESELYCLFFHRLFSVQFL